MARAQVKTTWVRNCLKGDLWECLGCGTTLYEWTWEDGLLNAVQPPARRQRAVQLRLF